MHTFDPKIPAIDHIRCITRIANKVGVTEKTKRLAVKIMRNVIAMQVSAGKGPMGIKSHCALRCLPPHGGNQDSEGAFNDSRGHRGDNKESLQRLKEIPTGFCKVIYCSDSNIHYSIPITCLAPFRSICNQTCSLISIILEKVS